MKYVRYQDGTVAVHAETMHIVNGMQVFEADPARIPATGVIEDLLDFIREDAPVPVAKRTKIKITTGE